MCSKLFLHLDHVSFLFDLNMQDILKWKTWRIDLWNLYDVIYDIITNESLKAGSNLHLVSLLLDPQWKWWNDLQVFFEFKWKNVNIWHKNKIKVSSLYSYMMLPLTQLQMNLSNLALIWILFPSCLIYNKRILWRQKCDEMICKRFVYLIGKHVDTWQK